MQFDLKKARVDLIAILVFAAVSLLFCYQQLQGKKLMQHDNVSWIGASQEAKTYYESTHKDALWTNSMFGGMPSYTIYVGASNNNYTVYIQQVLQAIGKPAYFFFIAMVCFYLLMRILKINPWLAAAGAFAYAFSTYNPIIIAVGHETKMLTMGYLPAALAGLYLIYDRKYLIGAALWGVFLALMISNNHFQVLYYYLFIFVSFGVVMLFTALKNGQIKQYLIASGIALAVAGIGVGPSLPVIMTTQEYAKETMRGGGSELKGHDKKTNGGLDKDYAFRWSNGIGETFCLMIPYLYGGASNESADKAPKTKEIVGENYDELPLYWGPQPVLSGPVYFGAVVCFLFVLGFLVVKSAHKWWILSATIISIVLSWGKNFEAVNYFLFDHLPMLNKFRTPSMALVVAELLFPMFGVWAVQAIIDESKNKAELWKKIKVAGGITAGLCLLLGLGSSMFFDFTGPGDAQLPAEILKALKDDRASLAMKSGLLSGFYILVATGLLWAYINDRIKSTVLIGGVAALFFVDLWPTAHAYLNDKKYKDPSEYETVFEPRQVDQQILQDKDPYYRVFDLSKDTYNDAVQSYFHKCVGGYSPAKMEIYQDLIERQLQKMNGEVLNMLNTKYIIVGGQKGPERVIPNPGACGNAWFVDEVKYVPTAEDEMNALNAPSLGDTTVIPNAFQPKHTAIVRESFKSQLAANNFGKDSAASIKLTQYGLDELSFESNNSKDGVAVFSDIYYPHGWKAYINGKETPIVRANYVLRAIKVPAGKNKIEFKFYPDSFYKNKPIAVGSSIALLLLCGAALFVGVKKKD